MARKVTHMSLEGGVLFFEDGTEVSGISVEMIKALPSLIVMCKLLRKSIRHSALCLAPKAFPCTCDADALWRDSEAILKATGEPV